MKVYNKFVESKKEPYNKNDIWFDGKVFKVYKEGEWQAITLELEAADKIYEIIKDISNVYQEKLTAGDGISIKNNTISLETFYQVVNSLPKTGKTNTIYLVNSKDAELNNKLVEYIWINNTWEKLGEHKTEIKIPTPDWNAKEGEGGFIKNKPFRFIAANGSEYKFKNSLKVEDFTPIYNEYNEIYLYKKPIDADGLQYVVCNKKVSSNGDIYETLFYPVSSENGKHRVNLEDYSGYVYTEVDDEGYYYLIVETDLSDMFFPENSVYVIDNYEDIVTVETLPEGFLSPITLKTTKQYLSSKDKKQVLTNLDLVDVARQKDVDKLNEETTTLWKDLKEGYHPNSTVGFSDDLVGRGESVPAEFSFRASGGKSIKDGSARIKRLKGNSVVWNQHYPTGWNWSQRGVITNSSNGVITSVGVMETTFFNIQPFASNIANHRYLFIVEGLSSTFSGNFGLLNRNAKTKVVNGFAAVFHTNSDTSLGQSVGFDALTAGTEINETYTVVQYDLTQMFQAGNEPTTIEEFNARKPIVEDEYAYNEGQVIHCNTESIKSVGDNAWDEEWELGYINPGNGNESDSSSYIRSKNYCRIIGGEEYYLKHTTGGDDSDAKMFIVLYDENHSYLDYWGIPEIGRTIQFDSRAQYFKVSFRDAYGTTYKNDVMISLMHSGWKADTDAKYQPYWEDRLMFDKRIKDAFPNGMQKWDMVYNKNGKGYIVKGTGSVDMGTLEYVTVSTNLAGSYRMRSTSRIVNAVAPTSDGDIANILCDRYIAVSNDDNWWNKEGVCIGTNGYLSVYDADIQDAESFKSAMAGVPLYYQLAEPTIIEYDEPFNLDYRVADFGTEEIIAEQPSAPFSADIIYQFNAVDMIREHELEITELQKKINEGNDNPNINSVVWKYICNPLVITTGLTMDKYSELIDPNTGGLKYKIPAMYRMIYNCDSPDFNSNSNFANIPVIPSRIEDFFMNCYNVTTNANSKYVEALFEDDVWTVSLNVE